MTDRPRGFPGLPRWLSCIRFDEVLVLQGPPLLGAFLSSGSVSATALALLAVANGLLVAHVFLLNDWAGAQQDLRDPARAARVFLARGFSRQDMAALFWILLLLSLLLLSLLGGVTAALGLAIAGVSALYSAPGLHLKGVPLANTALHLVGGLLHFLLGYSVFAGLDGRGVELGLYFATVFCAGHLTQEVRDFEADLGNGIQTNAVRFGQRRSFLAGFALFTLANALLLGLALRGTVPLLLAWVTVLYPLHLYWTLQALREGLRPDSVRRLQSRYRVLYAGIGGAMVLSVALA